LTIKEFLDLALDVLFSHPTFATKQACCVFLYDETKSVYKMTAMKKFPDELLETCKEIKAGWCICGLAASRKELVYKDCVDSEHLRSV
ncbi:sensory histidine protein kinase, partial [Candidatus Magnetobacterium bavaricum]